MIISGSKKVLGSRDDMSKSKEKVIQNILSIEEECDGKADFGILELGFSSIISDI